MLVYVPSRRWSSSESVQLLSRGVPAPFSKYVARRVTGCQQHTRRPLSKIMIACVPLVVAKVPCFEQSSYISDAWVPWIEDLVKVLLSHLFSQRHDELHLVKFTTSFT